MNLAEAQTEFGRLSDLLTAGLAAMREQAVALADAENAYRKAQAEAWVRCPNDDAGTKPAEKDWTAARRETWVKAQTADLRRTRDIADGMARASYAAVRSRQTQISALQTLLNAYQQEMKFAQTGPGMAA